MFFYDGTELDDLSLNDIYFPANDHLQEDQTMPNEFILDIVARAPLKTCVIHGENRITVPSNGNTTLREVITEAIDRMNIEEKDPSNLKIFGGLDRQTQIDLELNMDEIKSYFDDSEELIVEIFIETN